MLKVTKKNLFISPAADYMFLSSYGQARLCLQTP